MMMISSNKDQMSKSSDSKTIKFNHSKETLAS